MWLSVHVWSHLHDLNRFPLASQQLVNIRDVEEVELQVHGDRRLPPNLERHWVFWDDHHLKQNVFWRLVFFIIKAVIFNAIFYGYVDSFIPRPGSSLYPYNTRFIIKFLCNLPHFFNMYCVSVMSTFVYVLLSASWGLPVFVVSYLKTLAITDLTDHLSKLQYVRHRPAGNYLQLCPCQTLAMLLRGGV